MELQSKIRVQYVQTQNAKMIYCVLLKNQVTFMHLKKTNSFRGKYHVLGGVLSPLDGIGPDDLTIDNLMSRVTNGMEVILATNPSVER